MITPLKDMDGNYIPLDTTRLYDGDGALVKVTAYSYMADSGTWCIVDSYGEIFFPCNIHQHRPSADDSVEELWRHMEKCFVELLERCK